MFNRGIIVPLKPLSIATPLNGTAGKEYAIEQKMPAFIEHALSVISTKMAG
ncbi:hypothetical protein [Polymorphobacter multimanifer]|nr:hypothetical protein [Polymorphobacter multimanifer]